MKEDERNENVDILLEHIDNVFKYEKLKEESLEDVKKWNEIIENSRD